MTSPYLAPEISPDTAAIWSAASRGVLLVPQCTSCGKSHWYPRPFCPFCFGEVELQEATGRATLYSYSHTIAGQSSYVIAYVRLEEGPIAMTRIEDVDPAGLQIDMPLQVDFIAAENGQAVPIFKPRKD